MSMFSKLLISIIAAGVITNAHAFHTGDLLDPNNHELFTAGVNGFIFTQQFGDNNWQENRTAFAMNLDATFSDHLRFSTQLSTIHNDKPVRRATVEFAHPITSINTEASATYGLLYRKASFFNNATDNPGTAGTAMLPFAGYNHRMQTGTFTLMKGYEVKASTMLPNKDVVTARYSKGEVYIDDEEELNTYVFGTYRPGIDITAPNNSFDYSVTYESECISLLYAYSHYTADTALKSNATIVERITQRLISEVNLNQERVGAKFHNNLGWIQGEWVNDKAPFYGTNRKETFMLEGKTYYVQAGVYLNDYYSVYATHNRGKQYINGQYRQSGDEVVIGSTRETGVYALSVEWHKGYGDPWMKYDAVAPYEWNTWVMSFTYRFQ